MKKLFSTLAICTSLAALNASGQAYFLFQSAGHSVWENFTTGGTIIPAPAGSVDVAFLIGTGTPLIGTSGTPTNAESISDFGPIFSDPNFHFAIDANTGQIAVGTTSGGVAAGGFSYNSGVSFPVEGTTPGATYNVFVVGWSSTFATPQAAAAASSLFGWSNTFSYDSGISNIGTELPFSTSGMNPFGLVIPEPSTLSLASLGTLAIASFRSRK